MTITHDIPTHHFFIEKSIKTHSNIFRKVRKWKISNCDLSEQALTETDRSSIEFLIWTVRYKKSLLILMEYSTEFIFVIYNKTNRIWKHLSLLGAQGIAMQIWELQLLQLLIHNLCLCYEGFRGRHHSTADIGTHRSISVLVHRPAGTQSGKVKQSGPHKLPLLRFSWGIAF